ncbi:DUF1990 domain-containing protein [Couchioplanes caeruleus]|uniref:DUF1990 family protein n=1 Tax=Couchioplanes caeruleus TaxID=56438 RepID=UPI0020BED0F8|nr:DUF1990 domain-containing protein [Couchioplanes caeruleus]UQU66767.1 DUF1990 domain-containing protein [Couchioplanes caeruleus]
MTGYTYAEVGATRHDPLPPGYRHLHYRTYLGRGVFDCAAEAILTFRMHRGTGARITSDAPRAAPGVRVRVGLGPVTVPCEVVWAAEDPDRAGFGYGTLPGHQATGEEAFMVERDADGGVWFSVTAFSRPARPLMRLGGPVAVLAQHLYARLCARALRRLCARSRTVDQ